MELELLNEVLLGVLGRDVEFDFESVDALFGDGGVPEEFVYLFDDLE